MNLSYENWLTERGLNEAPAEYSVGAFVREISTSATLAICAITRDEHLLDDLKMLRRFAIALDDTNEPYTLIILPEEVSIPLRSIIYLHSNLRQIYLFGFQPESLFSSEEIISREVNGFCCWPHFAPKPSILRMDPYEKRMFWEKVRPK